MSVCHYDAHTLRRKCTEFARPQHCFWHCTRQTFQFFPFQICCANCMLNSFSKVPNALRTQLVKFDACNAKTKIGGERKQREETRSQNRSRETCKTLKRPLRELHKHVFKELYWREGGKGSNTRIMSEQKPTHLLRNTVLSQTKLGLNDAKVASGAACDQA